MYVELAMTSYHSFPGVNLLIRTASLYFITPHVSRETNRSVIKSMKRAVAKKMKESSMYARRRQRSFCF